LKKPNSFGGKKGRNYGWKIPILLGAKKKRENCQVMVEKTQFFWGGKKGRNYG
jgi:hypothetical protein